MTDENDIHLTTLERDDGCMSSFEKRQKLNEREKAIKYQETDLSIPASGYTGSTVRPVCADQPQGVWHSGQSPAGETGTNGRPLAKPGTVVGSIDAESPVEMICYNCRQPIQTYLHHENGTFSYVSCVCLFMCGCVFGCCLLPFFLDYFKDGVHKCPKCHVILGRHKKLNCF